MKQQPLPDLTTFSSRLRHLHNIVSLVPDKQFNLAVYSNDCGTVGCALGWATQDPAFQAIGLQAAGIKSWAPRYGVHDDFTAARKLFGFDFYDDCSHLFSIHSYGCDPLVFKSLDDGRGLFKKEFLKRLNTYIEEAEIKENVSHEATTSA